MTDSGRPVLLGTSLKLYLTVAESEEWARAVADIARTHLAVRLGLAELFVLPALPALDRVVRALGEAPVAVGAQDLSPVDHGAYTGGVSGADLADVGCRYVEVGHSERASVFGEGPETVRAKFAAAVRNGLVPVLCVGDGQEGDAEAAALVCIAQLEYALGDVDAVPELVVAYEPVWAIGRTDPAPAEHVVAVAARLRAHLADVPRVGAVRILYGGSAQPGLLARVTPAVDGLFLGRFAHDPAAVAAILGEVPLGIR